MKNINLLTTLILFLFFLSDSISAQQVSGKVIRIKDGDSFVLATGSKNIIVRLNGIDCPELDQPFGEKARSFTARRVENATLVVNITGYDQYKRALCDVGLPGNRSLNKELLVSGLAWVYTKSNAARKLYPYEKYAKTRKLGVWSVSKPVPPWEFRKQKKKNTDRHPN